jgi:ABC-type phosphate/phosphonate transport system permease subunit
VHRRCRHRDLAAFGIFFPTLPLGASTVALCIWLLATGAVAAVGQSVLPDVLPDPTTGAAAAGLISRVAALTTSVTPSIWMPVLASGRWPLFLAIIAAWWLAS